MADEIERKRVTLHPLKHDGTIDLNTNLYPKTFLDGIVDRDGNPVDLATQEELDEAIQEVKDAEVSPEELDEAIATVNERITTVAGDLTTEINNVAEEVATKASEEDLEALVEEVAKKASIFELDLSSLMSQEEILSLAQYLAGFDEELEKSFLFSELIQVSDYLEYSQIKLKYRLPEGEPSGIILNKKYETEGNPQFIYEDLEAGITLKLFDGGLTASKTTYTREELDEKFANKQQKLKVSDNGGIILTKRGDYTSIKVDSDIIASKTSENYWTAAQHFSAQIYADNTYINTLYGSNNISKPVSQIALLGDIPSDCVTLNTNQTITGQKTFAVSILPSTSAVNLGTVAVSNHFGSAYINTLYGSNNTAIITDNIAVQSWVSSNFLSVGTSIPAEQVPADWEVNDPAKPSYIKNKPILGTIASYNSEAFLSANTPIPTDYASVGALSSETFIPSIYTDVQAASVAHTHTYIDVGAASAAHTHTYSEVGALSAATYIPDITGLASEGYVDNAISALSSVYAPVGNYATNSDLSSAVSNINSTISSLDYASIGALSSTTHIPVDQVNADWNATTGVSSILHKPNLGTAAFSNATAFLPASTVIPTVGGTANGTNWVTITLNNSTYSIPQGMSSVNWGNINGNLSSQTDLQAALDSKVSVDAINTLALNLAPAWISSHGTYRKGDVVLYTINNCLYECIEEHTAGNAYNPTNTTYWKKTTLVESVLGLLTEEM